MKAILFNGPPRTGKDTTALAVAEALGAPIRSLSMPIRTSVFSLAGLQYSDALYEEIKDTPLDIFKGDSIREVMIALSERFIKPRYGSAFWAHSLLQGLNAPTIIVPDLGFPEELEAFQATCEDVLVVHTSREGFGWANDSRRYVEHTNVLKLETTGQPILDATKVKFFS